MPSGALLFIFWGVIVLIVSHSVSHQPVLQKRNESTFEDIYGVFCITNDMILAATTPAEHDAIAHKVLDCARKKNVKFNPNKIQWKVAEVKYMGHVLTCAGICPDEDKVQAVLELPTPQSRLELQLVLGVVNYLGRFIPNRSTITMPLCWLLKKEAAWEWHGEHDTAYQLLKPQSPSSPC